MKIVQPSFFVGDISVPSSTSDTVISNLQYFIDKYEASYLQRVLGHKMQKAISDITETSVIPDEIKNILDGCTFSFDGDEYAWSGLKNKETTPISRYIYYKYVCASQSRFDGIGMTQSASVENGLVPVSPSEKLVEVWKDCSDQTHTLLLMMLSNIEDYNNENYKITQDSIIKAALEFKKINIFGI